MQNNDLGLLLLTLEMERNEHFTFGDSADYGETDDVPSSYFEKITAILSKIR